MRRLSLLIIGTVVATASAAANATTTAQQKCDAARIKAWAKYVSCVDGVLAKDAKGVSFDQLQVAFAKCRHTYFKVWTKFQTSGALATSTCALGLANRYVDNGDLTVTDNLSGLTWEKKDDSGGIHDKDNIYTWSTGSPYRESGTTFTAFLSTLNAGGGFGGANGWRLPTLAELQTILADFACSGEWGGATCSCPSTPCVDPALDASTTRPANYWSATSWVPNPIAAWFVQFSNGYIDNDNGKGGYLSLRAVRGGL